MKSTPWRGVKEYLKMLTVRFWTHTAGGVTQKDIDGARVANRLAAGFVSKDK